MLRTHRHIRHLAPARTSPLTGGFWSHSKEPLLHSKQAYPLPPQQTCMHIRGAVACRRALWVRRDQVRSQNGHVRAEAGAVRRSAVTPHGMCSWYRSAADGMGHEVNGPCHWPAAWPTAGRLRRAPRLVSTDAGGQDRPESPLGCFRACCLDTSLHSQTNPHAHSTSFRSLVSHLQCTHAGSEVGV